jgi:hypothetical protein
VTRTRADSPLRPGKPYNDEYERIHAEWQAATDAYNDVCNPAAFLRGDKRYGTELNPVFRLFPALQTLPEAQQTKAMKKRKADNVAAAAAAPAADTGVSIACLPELAKQDADLWPRRNPHRRPTPNQATRVPLRKQLLQLPPRPNQRPAREWFSPDVLHNPTAQRSNGLEQVKRVEL